MYVYIYEIKQPFKKRLIDHKCSNAGMQNTISNKNILNRTWLVLI